MDIEIKHKINWNMHHKIIKIERCYWEISWDVHSVHVCSLLEEEGHHVLMARVRSVEQGRPPSLIMELQLCSLLQWNNELCT